MELDQEVRAFFTSDGQVEAKRLNLYVRLLPVCINNILINLAMCRKTSSSAKLTHVSQSKKPKIVSRFFPRVCVRSNQLSITLQGVVGHQ